ncbi:MAG: transposase [Lachnospiraceae bacterium]|nr:transposase [Lachnospiraceae bacterium]
MQKFSLKGLTQCQKCAAALTTDCILKIARAALVVRKSICLIHKKTQGGTIMLLNHVKTLLHSAISKVADHISKYSVSPEKDFKRHKKLPPEKLMSLLISEGSSSTKVELLDFFNFSEERVTASALNQQRAKLKPEALEQVMHEFNNRIFEHDPHPGYRCIAADGSTATYFSQPSFSPEAYFVDQGHSQKGFYSMHINAFQDLRTHIYTDILIQPVHEKDEFKAFCSMVDRHPVFSETKNIYIGDRGYCSYNNMAHVVASDQRFLFRTKDIHSKGLVGKFDYPESDTFDIDVNVTLVRSNSRKIHVEADHYRRFVDKAASFDYLEYGSENTYDISFRIVRFNLSETTYECLITNLPREEFDIQKLKLLYFSRWGIMPIST